LNNSSIATLWIQLIPPTLHFLKTEKQFAKNSERNNLVERKLPYPTLPKSIKQKFWGFSALTACIMLRRPVANAFID